MPAVALEVAEVVDPEPGEGQVLLEVVRTGICGSAPALVRGHAGGQGFPCRRAGGCRNAGEAGIPAPLGGWRDPSNTQADLREAFATAGFEWVTTHAFRKTVATLMDHAGLSSRAAADQLGHASTSMTTDVYFGRKVAITGAAAVLEALGS